MIPKHGANSARTKKCAKYKAEGRRECSKARHTEQQKTFTEKKAAKRANRQEEKVQEKKNG